MFIVTIIIIITIMLINKCIKTYMYIYIKNILVFLYTWILGVWRAGPLPAELASLAGSLVPLPAGVPPKTSSSGALLGSWAPLKGL